MVATLKKFLSSRGDILADDRSNTLIIRDIPSSSAGDRQSASPARPQIAASGNRSARGRGQPLVLSRNRYPFGLGWRRTSNIWWRRPLLAPARSFSNSGSAFVVGLAPPVVSRPSALRHGSIRCLPTWRGDRRRAAFTYSSIAELCAGYDHHRGGRRGRRQAALEAQDHHAEQPEGYRQARYQDPGADHR